MGAPDGGKSLHHLLSGRPPAVTAFFSRSGSRAHPRGRVINQIELHDTSLTRSIEDMRSTLIPIGSSVDQKRQEIQTVTGNTNQIINGCVDSNMLPVV
jgi:hypothetical protein